MSAAHSITHIVARTRYGIEQRSVAHDYQRPWNSLSRHEQNNLARDVGRTIEAMRECGFIVREPQSEEVSR
jgi:hypothetical protein